VTPLTFSQTTVENKSEKNTKIEKQLSGIITDTTQIEKHLRNPFKSTTLRYEQIYFVLGTLSDYMGRFQYVVREKQVDRYYPHEKPLVDYLTKYIKTELNIQVDTTFEKSKHCEMYSNELSKILNSFYGTQDKLIDSKFKTNEQIYSFLAGVYYRYGDKLDTCIYKIELANSPKHQNCYDFLKRIGCKKIFYKYLNNIPAQFILYFEPTDELKSYLNIIESQRLILQESNKRQTIEMLLGYLNKESLEKKTQISRQLEVEYIRNAFK
jgi:hypothetical protein